MSKDYDDVGPLKSVNKCLVDGGFLPKELVDPSGQIEYTGLACHTYMIANRSSSLGVFIMAQIDALPQTGTEIDGILYPSDYLGYCYRRQLCVKG